MRFLSYLFILLLISSCNSSNEKSAEKKNSEIARDKKNVPNEISESTSDKMASPEGIMIGDIEFAKENLAVTTYRNGDPIPQAKTKEEWKAFADKKEGCYAYSDFKKGEKSFELVYSGYCVSDKRGLAPEGWKIPSRDDWEKAIEALGGEKVAGKRFKSADGWKIKGDNSTGFDAVPLPFLAGDFNHDLQCVYYWSSSMPDNEYHYHFDLRGDGDDFSTWYDYDGWGLYVRCVKE